MYKNNGCFLHHIILSLSDHYNLLVHILSQAMSGKKRYLCDESHTLNVLRVQSSEIIFLFFLLLINTALDLCK